MSVVWKDFTGRAIKDGDDVVISINNEMHSAVVLGTTFGGSELNAVYNEWDRDGNEHTHNVVFMEHTHPDGIIKNLFKIYP